MCERVIALLQKLFLWGQKFTAQNWPSQFVVNLKPWPSRYLDEALLKMPWAAFTIRNFLTIKSGLNSLNSLNPHPSSS